VLGVVPASAIALGPELVTTAGTWTLEGETALFSPRFGPVAGSAFVLVGRADVRGQPWRELARFVVPDAGHAPTTVVESIDPTVDTVPANLLRFAVTFSAEMNEGSAAGNVRLLDESGAEVLGALLDMPPELWDRGRRRLTVLLEPGRIKRGLQPNVQAGAPLHEGGSVTVVVGSGIRDAGGAALVGEARRDFRVGAPIRSRVDPASWDVRWPDVDGDPLVVLFDRSLDRALVRRHLGVVDRGGHPVSGTAILDPYARRWEFTSVEAQAATSLRLRIDTRLEDLAGNSVRRVFDRDLRQREDDGIDDRELFLGRP
jgi:hypothetical protein